MLDSIEDTLLKSSSSDEVRIVRWTANPKRRAIRVHATCAGVLCIIYLFRGKHLTSEQEQPGSFCARLYDSVQAPSFQFDTRTHRRLGKIVSVEEHDGWLRPLKGPEWMRIQDHGASNELFDLIRTQLPGAVQPRSSFGTFCYLTVDDDPQHPGRASIKVRSEVYRQYTLGDLCILEPEMFSNIERIDLSQVRTFHDYVKNYPQVLKVSLASADGDSVDELILKIAEMSDYDGPERLPQSIEKAEGFQQLHFQELVNWSKVWGHENIMSPPKYLVTVQDGDCVRLVGWLQEVHRNWSDKLMRPHRKKGDHATARKLLGYVTDLARGMLHMTKKGYIHPDVQNSNCLFAGPENDDHLVIFDFEPFPQGPGVYSNLTGPESPEVVGHWEVSFDDCGRLSYSRTDPRGRYKEFSILVDWADFPEALERLQVFTFACVAADILTYRSPNRDHWQPHQLTGEEPETLKARRTAWEGLLPDGVKTLLEECWSFDPNQRPLFEDILRRLTEIRNAMDAPSSTDIPVDQSKDGTSST